MFCDNLQDQISEQFLFKVKAKNGIIWFRVKDPIDIWQPVNNGYAVLYKRLISQIQEESDENIDLWLRNLEKKLPASDGRILITHLQLADYNKTRYCCFEKTVCLIISDGQMTLKLI